MEHSGPTSTKRVLIVEDDDTARETLKEFLDLSGYDVACAGNADDALAEAERLQPDILVSDWKLGERRDGADIARRLQKDYDVRIVFITGNPLEQLRRSTTDLDVEEYLRKPVSLPRLVGIIRTIVPTRH